MKIYACECGRIFDKPNSFNGHKSKCHVHLEQTGKLAKKLEQDRITNKKISITMNELYANQKEEKLTKWIAEQHQCERCGKVMTEYYGSGRFCSRSCANSNPQSTLTRELISVGVQHVATELGQDRHQRCVEKYESNPVYCVSCGKRLSYERREKKTCGDEACIKVRLRAGGIKGIQTQGDARRSKNEILFAELCQSHFSKVETNVPLFDGWDADVIIHDYKLAILWNGSWHFDKLTEKHSVLQVQTRDKLKIQAIKDYGYTPYIIEDHGGFNKNFVKEQFNTLLQYLS